MIWNFTNDDTRCPGRDGLDAYLAGRLDRLEAVLADRTWLTERFTIADILMADALRFFDKTDILSNRPACRAYADRATLRLSFAKAHADQIVHFEATAPGPDAAAGTDH